MAERPIVDVNQWYHLYVTTGPGQALTGAAPATQDNDLVPRANTRSIPSNPTTQDGLTAPISYETTSPNSSTNRWQIFPINATMYTLRCQSTGPNLWMGVHSRDDGELVPYLAHSNVSDASALLWSIGSWGDDYWWLRNAAEETVYLSRKVMDFVPEAGRRRRRGRGRSARAETNDDRKWKLKPLKIEFSTVNLISTLSVATTVPSSLPSSSSLSSSRSLPSSSSTPSSSSLPSSSTLSSSSITPTPTAVSTLSAEHGPSKSSGLSTSGKAGIGTALGVVALVAIALLIRFFWQKRQRSKVVAAPEPNIVGAAGAGPLANAHEPAPPPLPLPLPPTTCHELHTDPDAAKYEMPATSIAEVARNELPAELPGHEVRL